MSEVQFEGLSCRQVTVIKVRRILRWFHYQRVGKLLQ